MNSRLTTLIASVTLTLLAIPNFASADSLYLSEGQWTTHQDKSIKVSEFKGQPRVLTMIFTRCPSACPMIINDLKKIERALTPAARKKVRFTVMSFDSKNDTPEALRAFASKMKLGDNWDLLVANEADTREMAALLNVQYKQIPSGEFVHSNWVHAVDAEGQLLKSREGLGQPGEELARLLNQSLLPTKR
ncbi:MAG TPA: SCO family protein [Pseudobdellovibrionaceae bacterium]|nr:SCO family protein [Pseudobdellovibrionaceae bacterium]